MNKKKLLIFVFISMIFMKQTPCEITCPFSSGIVSFIPPNDKDVKWKEFNSFRDENVEVIEYMPSHQKPSNWRESDLITITRCSLKDKKPNSLDDVLKSLKSDPSKDCFYENIEKTTNNIICEFRMGKSSSHFPPQHEIMKIILTKDSIYTIEFTRTNKKISTEEKEAWMKLLREHATVSPLQKT